MPSGNVPERLKISTFKLNALLAITQAINENLPQTELLQRYEKLLKEDLNIGKVVIFKFNSTSWECLLSSGINENSPININVEQDLMKYSEITFVTSKSIPSSLNHSIL